MALYAFDGTWNKPDLTSDPERTMDTNVRRIWEAYKGKKEYIPGVGTRYGGLGLWDTVGSFGFPKNLIIPFQKINLGFHLTVPKAIVDHCFHAISLDERRETFRSTRVDGYEVWFRGVHSNVGGGYADRGLSDIALRWMLDKAESCGLAFDLSKTEALKPDVNGKFGKPNDPHLDPPRKLKSGDRVHPSAYECKGEREIPDSAVKMD